MTTSFARALVLVGLALAMAACDSGGAPDPEADAIELTVQIGKPDALLPGDVVVFGVEGGSVTGGMAYPAQLGQTAVDLHGTEASELLLVVPVIDSGGHELAVTLGNKVGSTRLAVSSYEPIEDPAAFVRASHDQSVASLQGVLEQNADNESVRLHVERLLEELERASAALDEMEAGDEALLAYALRELKAEYGAVGAQRSALKIGSSDGCSDEDLLEVVLSRMETVWVLGSIVRKLRSLASSIETAFSEAMTYLGWSSEGDLVSAINDENEAIQNALDCSFDPHERALDDIDGLNRADQLESPNFVTAGSRYPSLSTLEFEHGQAKTLALSTGYELNEEGQSALALIRSNLSELADVLPEGWATQFTGYAEAYTTNDVPPTLSLTNLPSNIEGELARSAESLTLTFRFLGTQPAGSANFTFDLVDDRYPDFLSNHPSSISPRLDYVIDIGDYNPSYENITPQYTIEPGQSITLYNGVTYMARLRLDGDPVSVGEYGLAWSQIPIDEPIDQNDIILDSYDLTLYDYDNRRNATITTGATVLSNQGYRSIVGSTLTFTPYSGDTPASYHARVTFSNDGTATRIFSDGSGGDSIPYSFVNVITPSYVTCHTYQIDKPIIGAIRTRPGWPIGGSTGSFVMIYEDGTFAPNSFYGCQDRHSHVRITR